MVYSFFNNLEEAQQSVFMVHEPGEAFLGFAWIALTISTGCDCIIKFVQMFSKDVMGAARRRLRAYENDERHKQRTNSSVFYNL